MEKIQFFMESQAPHEKAWNILLWGPTPGKEYQGEMYLHERLLLNAVQLQSGSPIKKKIEQKIWIEERLMFGNLREVKSQGDPILSKEKEKEKKSDCLRDL